MGGRGKALPCPLEYIDVSQTLFELVLPLLNYRIIFFTSISRLSLLALELIPGLVLAPMLLE
jgi:hypothetical protein